MKKQQKATKISPKELLSYANLVWNSPTIVDLDSDVEFTLLSKECPYYALWGACSHKGNRSPRKSNASGHARNNPCDLRFCPCYHLTNKTQKRKDL